jgi:hypothetical protein
MRAHFGLVGLTKVGQKLRNRHAGLELDLVAAQKLNDHSQPKSITARRCHPATSLFGGATLGRCVPEIGLISCVCARPAY